MVSTRFGQVARRFGKAARPVGDRAQAFSVVSGRIWKVVRGADDRVRPADAPARREAAEEHSRGRSEARERRAPPPVGWANATGRARGRAGSAAYAAGCAGSRFRGRRSALTRLASPPAIILRRFAAPAAILLRRLAAPGLSR